MSEAVSFDKNYPLERLIISSSLIASTLMGQQDLSAIAAPEPVALQLHQEYHDPVNALPDEYAEKCADISQRSRDVAALALNAPENPLIEQMQEVGDKQQIQHFTVQGPGIREDRNTQSVNDIVFSARNQRRMHQVVAQESAEKFGVTLHNAEPFLEPLDKDIGRLLMNQQSTLSFAEYFNQAAGYLQQFGVTLEAPQPQLAGKVEDMPTAQQLESSEAKRSLYNIIKAFSAMPQEYVDLSKLNAIRLIEKHEETPHAAFAAHEESNRVMLINSLFGVSEDTVFHEMGHYVDATTCGGQSARWQDPVYTSHNFQVAYQEGVPHFNYQGYTQQLATLRGRVIGLRSQRNFIDACTAQSEVRAFQAHDQEVSLYTDYSGTNTIEDKAEIDALIPDADNMAAALDPRTPRIKAKLIELTARVYNYAPAVFRYFASVSKRLPAAQHLDRDLCWMPLSASRMGGSQGK